MQNRIFLLGLLALASVTAHAQMKTDRTEEESEGAAFQPLSLGFRMSEVLSQNSDPTTATVTGEMDQILDPTDPAHPVTFKQRYYLNSFYASGPTAPVLLYICGEAACTPSFVTRFVGELASHFHAHMVALEHRYYGKSSPFPKLSPDNLKYLKTSHALADLARFQDLITTQKSWKGPWIVIGGSYAGSLAAYYRMLHPDKVIAALASSAPVEARLDYPEFDSHSATHVPELCRKSVLAVSDQVEGALGQPGELARLKSLFNASSIRDAADFLFFVADFAAESVQYGKSDELCNAINPQLPLESYSQFVKANLASTKREAADFTYQPQFAPDGSLVFEGSEWTYQSCTEYGYWQTRFHNPAQTMRSARIQVAQFQKLCSDLFGIQDAGLSGISALNQKFYEKLENPSYASNIIFTNGTQDPWSELSIASFRKNDRNPATPVISLEGGSHCSDLRASDPKDPVSFQTARNQIQGILASWLSLTANP